MKATRAVLVSCTALLLSVLPVYAQVWEELGPAPIRDEGGGGAGPLDTGRAAAVAVSSTQPDHYYVGGASAGVWETIDGGQTWTELNAGLPILTIGALAVDPRNDNVVYAGSGESNNAYHSLYGLGLYKSTDRGRTWRVLAPDLFAGRAFSRIVVSPFDSNDVWATISRAGGSFTGNEGAKGHPGRDGAMGLFRSRDGGETWSHLRAPEGLPPRVTASDVDLHPLDDQRVFVTFGDPFGHRRNGIYRSNDGGRSFENISPVPGERFGRTQIAIAPSDPDRIYALVAKPLQKTSGQGFFPGGSHTWGVLRSDDGGDSWTRSNPGDFQRSGAYNSAITVDPDDPDTFYLGGVLMLRSTDGGRTYEDVTPLHVDLHGFAWDAAGRLLAADDGGLHRTVNRGDTWTALNDGLGMVQFYAGLSVHPTDPDFILGGTQDNGTNLRTGNGLDWTRIFGGDGGYTAVRPDDPDVLFLEYQGAGNLFRSNDGGLTFRQASGFPATGERTSFLPPFVLDPSDPERMLYATHRIFESTNGGRTWSPISRDLTKGEPAAIRALVISPSHPKVVYAATNDGRVLASLDGGAKWKVIRANVAGWPRVMRQLAVDPRRPNFLAVAVSEFDGDRVLVTANRGRTWSTAGDSLPNVPVNTVAIHRDGSRRFILAGTDSGVWLSDDDGASWIDYGTGFPRAPVTDLVVDLFHQRLVASTLGRGMWTAALPQ